MTGKNQDCKNAATVTSVTSQAKKGQSKARTLQFQNEVHMHGLDHVSAPRLKIFRAFSDWLLQPPRIRHGCQVSEAPQ